MSDDSRINWTEEEDEAFEALEHKQAQEEAHKHFVIQEFAALILADGPATVLGQMTKDARHELRQVILHEYMQRLSSANSGL